MDLLDRLLTTTYTTTAAHRRVGLVRHGLETVLYQDAGGSTAERFSTAITLVENAADRAALHALGTDWLESINTTNVSTTLEQLHTALESIPTFRLTVPCPFNAAAEATVGEWCRTHIQPGLLLDVTVDPDTVGGCAFVWNDVYHEDTITTRLRANPQTIPELLQTYV